MKEENEFFKMVDACDDVETLPQFGIRNSA